MHTHVRQDNALWWTSGCEACYACAVANHLPEPTVVPHYLPTLGGGPGGWSRNCMPVAHLAPDDAVLRALLQGLGLVDVGHPLAEVEVDLLLALHALDLQQRRVVVLVPQTPVRTGERLVTSVHVKPAVIRNSACRLSRSSRCCLCSRPDVGRALYAAAEPSVSSDPLLCQHSVVSLLWRPHEPKALLPCCQTPVADRLHSWAITKSLTARYAPWWRGGDLQFGISV